MIYKTGDAIEVRINTWDLSQENWEPGIFLSYLPCKIGYSFNVRLDDGFVINGVNPKCVRKKNEKEEKI